MTEISIVSTLYNSAEYIEVFLNRITTAVERTGFKSHEIILVNDGSPDSSLDIALEKTTLYPNLTILDLSRNFGHHKAMMTGLKHARGQHVFLIDIDLEEEPELLEKFWPELIRLKCDVIYGIQNKRKGKIFERISGTLFYWLLNKLTSLNLPKNLVTARLMSKRYVDALVSHHERELMMAGLWVITGFDQRPYTIRKHSTSPTTYSTARKINHFINAITSFSNQPLIFVFYLGLIVSLTAAIFILYHIINYFFGATPPSGYTSLIASIWLFSGLIIFVIGLQGIYISKIFTEVKQRPYTIIKEVYKKDLNT